MGGVSGLGVRPHPLITKPVARLSYGEAIKHLP